MDYGSEASRRGDSHGKRGGLKDMNTGIRSVFGSGFMLATLLLATFAAFSQEVPEGQNEYADLEPAIDTSMAGFEAEPAVSAVESAEPTAVLAEDVRRRATSTGVMDEIELGRTEITGNQELPKVMYIVPWQKSDPGDLMGKPVNTLLDEVLAPLNRDEFVRQVDYYEDLYGKPEE